MGPGDTDTIDSYWPCVFGLGDTGMGENWFREITVDAYLDLLSRRQIDLIFRPTSNATNNLRCKHQQVYHD